MKNFGPEGRTRFRVAKCKRVDARGSMLEELKQQWREFKRARPGHRFQERFERNREARSGRSWFTRFLKPVAAIVLVAAGVVFCLIPGPGLPLILFGAALLADISRVVARALDWLEVRIRDAISWARQWWQHASRSPRIAVIVLAVCIAGGAVYGGYRFVASHM